jgi:membrane associated rhomboid family serine protease
VILIPVGHEDSAVRRHPLVVYAVMAICTLALLATSAAVEEGDRRTLAVQPQLEEAFARWSERPYLRFEPLLVRELPPEARAQVEGNKASAPAEIDVRELMALQLELDRAFEAPRRTIESIRREHPYYVHGLVVGQRTSWGAVAHIFMHAGWLHLLGNLFLLFLAGPALEDRWGRGLFSAFFLGAGVFSGLFFTQLSSADGMPLVGASGAISGVLGAFFVRLWSTRIRFWYWIFFRASGTFSAPAYAMLPLWFANELLQAWLARAFGIDGGVAYEAHIGGFLFGLAVALAFKFTGFDEKLDADIDDAVTARGNQAVAEALALREAGDLSGALKKLSLEVRKHPGDSDAVEAYWDACVAKGAAGDAAHAVLALTQRELAANQGARAAQRFSEVIGALPGYGFDPALVARMVPHLREHDPRSALDALRWLAQPQRPALAPTLALRAFEQARDLDAEVAMTLAERYAASELPAEMREKFAAHAKSLASEVRPRAIEVEPEAEETPSERAIPAPAPPIDRGLDPNQWDRSEFGGAGEFDAADPVDSPPPQQLARTAPKPAAAAEDDWDALKILDAGATPASGTRFATLKVMDAAPLALEGAALTLALEGGKKAQLALDKVDAVALAAVRGLGAKPVLVIDLLMGWRSLAGGELRCIRLRSDRFDPRKHAAAKDPLAALRAFVAQLVATSGATPLAAADPARANQLTPYADAASYAREVLEVGG